MLNKFLMLRFNLQVQAINVWQETLLYKNNSRYLYV